MRGSDFYPLLPTPNPFFFSHLMQQDLVFCAIKANTTKSILADPVINLWNSQLAEVMMATGLDGTGQIHGGSLGDPCFLVLRAVYYLECRKQCLFSVCSHYRRRESLSCLRCIWLATTRDRGRIVLVLARSILRRDLLLLFRKYPRN